MTLFFPQILLIYLQVAAQLRQEGDGGSGLQVRVQVLLELRRHDAREVGEDARGNVDLAQHVHLRRRPGAELAHAAPAQTGVPGFPFDLQIGRERVGKSHVAWEGTEDEVAELDAVGRDHVAEAIVVVTQELWEVVQQDQKHSQRPLRRGEEVTKRKEKKAPNNKSTRAASTEKELSDKTDSEFASTWG